MDKPTLYNPYSRRRIQRGGQIHRNLMKRGLMDEDGNINRNQYGGFSLFPQKKKKGILSNPQIKAELNKAKIDFMHALNTGHMDEAANIQEHMYRLENVLKTIS